MKIKKSVKVIIILVILFGAGLGFYKFNKKFFSEHNVVKEDKKQDDNKKEDNNNEKKEDEEVEKNKEDNDMPIQEENPIEPIENKKEPNVIKQKASEIYYCSDGDVLRGNECITKIVIDAKKYTISYAEEEKDYIEVQFDFKEFMNEYELTEDEVIDILRESCTKEIKGYFRIDYNQHKGACLIKIEDEKDESNKKYTYLCEDSSFTLEGDKCVKEATILAKVRYGCPSGMTLDGIYCK